MAEHTTTGWTYNECQAGDCPLKWGNSILSYNQISDIGPLSTLTNLDELRLYGNQISDIGPLVANEGISDGDYVDLGNNPLSHESLTVRIPVLQGRGVDVDFTDLPPSGGISIPDENLEAAIRDALDKQEGDITEEDMASLDETLDASGRDIQDLTGLEHATNLDELILNDNQISDIGPLVANEGISDGDYVDLRNNPLSHESLTVRIPVLQGRGVDVDFTQEQPPQAPTCNGRFATIVGTDGPDNLVGTNGDDVIVGLGGDDLIRGLGGNDTICGGLGSDTILAGPGDDWVSGGWGHDTITGGTGYNTLYGNRGNDYIFGGRDDDLIYGGLGNDSLAGNFGDDVLYGGGGDDRLLGNEGADLLYGQPGNDTFDCGPGPDLANGGSGSDSDGTAVGGIGGSCEFMVNIP